MGTNFHSLNRIVSLFHIADLLQAMWSALTSDKAPYSGLKEYKFIGGGSSSSSKGKGKGKAIPLKAWTDPEGSRILRLADFKAIGTWRW